MIKFNQSDDNKQFISIRVLDNKPASKIYEYVRDLYDSINGLPHTIDNEEIVIELCKNSYLGFSLNDLRQEVKKKTDVVIGHFCVDLNEKSQRTYCVVY